MRESKGAEDENLVKLKKHYILPAKIANKKLAKKKKYYSASLLEATLGDRHNLYYSRAHKPQPKRQYINNSPGIGDFVTELQVEVEVI